MNKVEIIDKIYNDPESGFGSMMRTYQDARQIDNNITLQDVQEWFAKHIGRKTQLKGYNSFIPDGPYSEYQIDLFYFQDLNKESDRKQPYGLLLIDPFSKYCQVVQVDTKQPDDVLEAIKQGFRLMEAKPDTIYSDEEGAFVSNKIQQFFKSEDIRHLVTRGHAPYAERAIRTIKNMVYKRVEGLKNPNWTDHINNVLNMYNKKMVHSATGLTPDHARLSRYRTLVKMRLEMKRKSNRKYPQLTVGSKVRIYKKKDKLDKERTSTWSKDSYDVLEIIESMKQQLYKTTARQRPFMRSELLLVD